MYSLIDLYQQDIQRMQDFYLDQLEKNNSKIFQEERRAPFDTLEKLHKFLSNKNQQDSRSLILKDLPRTKYHSSLDYIDYCRKWLGSENRDYIQGMLDGGLCYLAIHTICLEMGLLKLPQCLLRFAYQNNDKQMSTFCLYFEYYTQTWCIAVCHDPFQDPLNLRYHIIHSSKEWTAENLKEIISNEQVVENTLKFIDENLSSTEKLDLLELEKKVKNFDTQFAYVDFFSHHHINQYLWGEHAYSPDPLSKKTFLERAFEIERDYKRVLIHPSLDAQKRQRIFSDWRQADIPYYQGLISGLSAVKKQEAGDELYDIKFNFIYQTNKGDYASLYFYYDLVNAKCFLAISDDLMHAYDEQYFGCIFPLEEIPDDRILAQLIKNSEVTELTKNLLKLLPRIELLANTDRYELKRKILIVQDCLKYQFTLETYADETTNYVQVQKPAQTLDDILPQLNVFHWLAKLICNLGTLLINVMQAIADFMIASFCWTKSQFKIFSM